MGKSTRVQVGFYRVLGFESESSHVALVVFFDPDSNEMLMMEFEHLLIDGVALTVPNVGSTVPSSKVVEQVLGRWAEGDVDYPGTRRNRGERQALEFASALLDAEAGNRRGGCAPLYARGRGWVVRVACLGTTKKGERCTMPVAKGSDYCYLHDRDPAVAERRSRNASRAATLGNSKVGTEIRGVRLMVRDLVKLTITNELHPLVLGVV